MKTLEEKEIERAINQVIRAAIALKNIEYVKPIAKECRPKETSGCICREAAIAIYAPKILQLAINTLSGR